MYIKGGIGWSGWDRLVKFRIGGVGIELGI